MVVLERQADPLVWNDQETETIHEDDEEPSGQRGADSSRWHGAWGGVTATHCPQLGCMWGMELPPQGVARGLTPGLLPLHLGWGTNPKEKGEESSMGVGWEGTKRG